MRKTVLTFWIIGFGLLLAAKPALAHHSFAAEFDRNKPVTFTGKVTKVEWTNPHAYIYIDVKDGTGKATNWAVELGSPNGLIRVGWTRNLVKIDDVVTVEGSLAKNKKNLARVYRVTAKKACNVGIDQRFAGIGMYDLTSVNLEAL